MCNARVTLVEVRVAGGIFCHGYSFQLFHKNISLCERFIGLHDKAEAYVFAKREITFNYVFQTNLSIFQF